MPSRVRVFIVCALIGSLTSAGCGARSYVVRAEDYANALDHGGVVGAVTLRCRETAVLAHRTRTVEIELDPLLHGDYDYYLAIQERSSRSLALGIGIGGILLGSLLSSMGGALIFDAASTPHPSGGDGLAEGTGKVLGSALVTSGAAFFVTGIAFIAQGATRGAEAPRRWQPSMTESTPCVVHRHDEAYERARRRIPARSNELK